MRKIVTAGLVLAGLVGSVLVGATSVAYAQTAVPSCAEALRAQSDAQTADAAARKVDQDAAAAAKTVTAAEKLHADLAAARVELAAAVKADNVTVPPLAKDSQRTVDAKALVARLEVEVGKLPSLDVLRVERDKVKAEADKTDAAVTGSALVKARTAANKACDPAPAPGTTPAPVRAPVPAPADRDCDDFASQAAAQSALNADRGDPNALDLDHDGIACEVNESVSFTQVDEVPAGSIDTGRA